MIGSFTHRQRAQNQEALQKHNVSSHQHNTLNYAKNLPAAPALVKPGANPFYILHNIQDTARWSLGLLQDGKDMSGDDMRIGDRYFVKSGTCSNVTSTPECQGKSRYIYVNNVPSSTVPCADPNQPSDPKSAKAPTGLLAGVVQDIVGLNPFELISSSNGSGSVVNSTCERRRERVDSVIPGQSASPRYETHCSPKRQPLVCSLSSTKQSTCVRYTPDDTPNVKAYNTDMQNVLSTMASTDYPLQLRRVIDQKHMADRPHQPQWTALVHQVNQQFQDALIAKYNGNANITVDSHKHCLTHGEELRDDANRTWLMALWTCVYQVRFESMIGVELREGDRVSVVRHSNDQPTAGNIKSAVNGTYTVKFDDGGEQADVATSDVVDLTYEFQVLWGACTNLTPYSRSRTFSKGDRVRVKRGGVLPFVDALVVQATTDGKYDVKYYDTGKTEQNVAQKHIRPSKTLITIAKLVGNSYKTFNEEPPGYYTVGVREPFTGGTPVRTSAAAAAAAVAASATISPSTGLMTGLLVIVLVCVLIRLFGVSTWHRAGRPS